MNTSAIIMMIIGCGGLWGGCIYAVYLASKKSKKSA